MRRRDGEAASWRIGASATRSRLDRHARTRLRRRRRRRLRRRGNTESNSGHLPARAGNGAGRKFHEETAREGDGAGTGDVERAHALTSGAAASHATESECTLVANRLSRAGGARDVNNLSRAGRAEFSALGDAMRAVTGICFAARGYTCWCTRLLAPSNGAIARLRNRMTWRAARVQRTNSLAMWRAVRVQRTNSLAMWRCAAAQNSFGLGLRTTRPRSSTRAGL